MAPCLREHAIELGKGIKNSSFHQYYEAPAIWLVGDRCTMGKWIWIEGREFQKIAKLAEEEGWSDEQLAEYLERRYAKQKK
jgi:hypothetical protein